MFVQWGGLLFLYWVALLFILWFVLHSYRGWFAVHMGVGLP